MAQTLPSSPAGPHLGSGSSAVVPFMRIDLVECKHVKSSLSPLQESIKKALKLES